MIKKDGINAERLHYLVQQYIANACSRKELDELLSLVKDEKSAPLIRQELNQYWNRPVAITDNKIDWDECFFNMMKEAKTESQTIDNAPVKHRRFYWVAAAASVLIILATGYYWFNHNHTKNGKILAENDIARRYKNDVSPGGNKAVLTLANGSKIILDSAHNGMLTRQGNTKIVKINNGQLAYNAANASSNLQHINYNIITTPRGGQYQIVLADGSKVWLNAASSLRFPTSFTDKERKVELTGEAYFEIAPRLAKKEHKKVPFIVKIDSPSGNGSEVEVLGTHFNIMAYADEAVSTTTLLEGSIKMINEKANTILTPGQQAILKEGLADIKVAAADTEEVVAWKNGYLQFNNSSLETIMRQISRWYNVDITYDNNIPQRFFTGKISRNVSLATVLKVLELSDVHFKIDGKKLEVIS